MKTNATQNNSKRAYKKQINIQWNSRLFFQLGIITSLLFTFFIMQAKFENQVAQIKKTTSFILEEPPIIEYVIDVDKPKAVISPKKVISQKQPLQKTVKSNVFEVKPNSAPDVETPVAPIDQPIAQAPVASETSKVNPKPKAPHSLISVEFVPVFPGCESQNTNAEKIACMSSKINSYINSNFKKSVLENLQTNEIHKVYVNFKIDSNGYVTEVKARSHNETLKNEAQRVVNGLPKMKPGKQGDQNVEVMYTVPIILKIN